MTKRLFKSSSINDFRVFTSKRILAPAILFAVLFAGAEDVPSAYLGKQIKPSPQPKPLFPPRLAWAQFICRAIR
jgi:hypothetical protein